jgi:ABC-type antimicrobial peptide transport system permease subunit
MTDIKMATASIKSTKIRSLLTMLGVIIGVTSVVMIISLGQGVKNQVVTQINQFGSDVITIRPGVQGSKISGVSLSTTVSASTLTNADIASIKSLNGIADVSQSSVITGNAGTTDRGGYRDAVIIASSPNTQKVLGIKIEFGEFFDQIDSEVNTAVIGSNVADALFKQRDPIGRILDVRGQEFSVRGVLAIMPENPLNIGTNYNNAIYIPTGMGKQISGDNMQISEINARVTSGYSSSQASAAIKQALIKSHGGQEDFTILRQDEYLNSANQLFDILTTFVAAIAGISLLVGGIGIMNIMLVSVSERTHEIGVRKALGATNRQILSQFLVESTAISLFGGILGILASLLASFLIRITTSIRPSLSLATILVAIGMATIVGVIFGMTPAIKAAHKDPIDALRHE